jgi:VanZ family protein
MSSKHLRAIFWIYMFSLIVLALLPLNSTTSDALVDTFVINIRLDYLLHSILFIPWILLYLLTFWPAKITDKLIMAGTGLLMAFTTEGIQYFLSYRSYNINDLLSNFLGVLIGSFVLLTTLPHKIDSFLKNNIIKQ